MEECISSFGTSIGDSPAYAPARQEAERCSFPAICDANVFGFEENELRVVNPLV